MSKDQQGGQQSGRMRRMWTWYRTTWTMRAPEDASVRQRLRLFARRAVVLVATLGIPIYGTEAYLHLSGANARMEAQRVRIDRCIELRAISREPAGEVDLTDFGASNKNQRSLDGLAQAREELLDANDRHLCEEFEARGLVAKDGSLEASLEEARDTPRRDGRRTSIGDDLSAMESAE